jgi:hypothetical protein
MTHDRSAEPRSGVEVSEVLATPSEEDRRQGARIARDGVESWRHGQGLHGRVTVELGPALRQGGLLQPGKLALWGGHAERRGVVPAVSESENRGCQDRTGSNGRYKNTTSHEDSLRANPLNGLVARWWRIDLVRVNSSAPSAV